MRRRSSPLIWFVHACLSSSAWITMPSLRSPRAPAQSSEVYDPDVPSDSDEPIRAALCGREHEGLQGLIVFRFPFHKEFTDSLRMQLRHGSATGSSWPNDNLAVRLSQFPQKTTRSSTSYERSNFARPRPSVQKTASRPLNSMPTEVPIGLSLAIW